MFQPQFNEKASPIQWPMILALFGLMLIGAAFIYSATANNDSFRHLAVYRQPWFKQVAYYGLGLGAALGVCLVSYRRLARWSLVMYWVTILLLIAVLVPSIGTTHGWGARRWIDLGAFQMQPSELAKIACILVQAHFLSRPVDELRFAGV